MSRSSARRGQVEPLAALAAVLVLGLALGLYAETLAAVEPSRPEPASPEATLQRVTDALSADAAAIPDRLPETRKLAPSGRELNVTLTADGRRWSVGPTRPEGASADRHIPVQIDRWSVEPGRLRVVVWS
jgi:hypothetical protein